jgi:DNA-directed RNA polymerase specialized sigma24 family protein
MEKDPYAEEQLLLRQLEKRDDKAILRLYKDYNDDLMIFAYSQLKDQKKAEEAVQELFETFWARTRFADITPPIYKFLVEQLGRICAQRMNP